MKWGEKHAAGSADWAVWDRQFDLTRTDTGEVYLTRWWILKTPVGGLALHRMLAPDARDVVHTHPFSFVSFPVVGGYIETRLDPKTWKTFQRHVFSGGRPNVVRAGLDAHTITRLLRVPTYTLLLIGPHRGTWGFLEPMPNVLIVDDDGLVIAQDDPNPRPGYGVPRWRWTRHDRSNSGHYAPERAARRR